MSANLIKAMVFAQSPLMVAVRTESLTVISSLLNARMPKVDVNFVKSVCNLFDLRAYVCICMHLCMYVCPNV